MWTYIDVQSIHETIGEQYQDGPPGNRFENIHYICNSLGWRSSTETPCFNYKTGSVNLVKNKTMITLDYFILSMLNRLWGFGCWTIRVTKYFHFILKTYLKHWRLCLLWYPVIYKISQNHQFKMCIFMSFCKFRVMF